MCKHLGWGTASPSFLLLQCAWSIKRSRSCSAAVFRFRLLCRLRDGVLLFVLSLRYSADLFSSSCSRVFSPAPPFLIVPLIFPLIVPLIVPFGGILAAVISVAIYQRSGLYSISITIYPLITSQNSKKHLISCIYQKNVVPLQPQRFYNRKIISAKRVAQ